MTDVIFRKEVFTPINTAYKLLVPLQHLKPHGNDKEWEKWVNDCEEYCNTIDDPHIKAAVSRFLIDMGDSISKINA